MASTPPAVRTSRGSASRPATSTVAMSDTPATIQPAAATPSLTRGGAPKNARTMHASRRAASPASNMGGRAVMFLWSPPRQVLRESGAAAVGAAPVDADDGAGTRGQDEQPRPGRLTVDVVLEAVVVDHPARPRVGEPVRHLRQLGAALGHHAEQVVERERPARRRQRGEQKLPMGRAALLIAPVLERDPAHLRLSTALAVFDRRGRRKCATLRGRLSVTLNDAFA